MVAAYGLILPEPILDAPRYGCLNVHASLLPRWRGAAPIQRAILAGDADDRRHHHADGRGARYRADARRELPVEIGRKTAGELTAELAAIGAALMVRGARRARPASARCPQNDARATYAPKIDKARGAARFRASRRVEVERQVRAFNPAPGAFFEYRGERIKVLAAEISEASGRAGHGARRSA